MDIFWKHFAGIYLFCLYNKHNNVTTSKIQILVETDDTHVFGITVFLLYLHLLLAILIYTHPSPPSENLYNQVAAAAVAA